MRLCLGTVQFGMDYGIQGGAMPCQNDALDIMRAAVEGGVDALDTAAAYGDAEVVVGRFLSMGNRIRESISIVSKFGAEAFVGAEPSDYGERLIIAARKSLSRLHTDFLDAYICHVPEMVGEEAVLSALTSLRGSGLARKVGFSVYEVDDAVAAIKSGVVDFLQVPYSVFDQRMARAGVFDLAATHGVEVHSRSAFVQGMALMEADLIPEWLAGARRLVLDLEAICAGAGTTRRRLALAFVKRRPDITHLVFGVDNRRQLEEVLGDFSAEVPSAALDEAERMFSEVDPALVMPNKWRSR